MGKLQFLSEAISKLRNISFGQKVFSTWVTQRIFWVSTSWGTSEPCSGTQSLLLLPGLHCTKTHEKQKVIDTPTQNLRRYWEKHIQFHSIQLQQEKVLDTDTGLWFTVIESKFIREDDMIEALPSWKVWNCNYKNENDWNPLIFRDRFTDDAIKGAPRDCSNSGCNEVTVNRLPSWCLQRSYKKSWAFSISIKCDNVQIC